MFCTERNKHKPKYTYKHALSVNERGFSSIVFGEKTVVELAVLVTEQIQDHFSYGTIDEKSNYWYCWFNI